MAQAGRSTGGNTSADDCCAGGLTFSNDGTSAPRYRYFVYSPYSYDA